MSAYRSVEPWKLALPLALPLRSVLAYRSALALPSMSA